MADQTIQPELTLEAVRNLAREKLKGICAVYPICDGGPDRICQRENYGKAIGLGGAGLGEAVSALNVEALAKIKSERPGDRRHAFEPETSFSFFGRPIVHADYGRFDRRPWFRCQFGKPKPLSAKLRLTVVKPRAP